MRRWYIKFSGSAFNIEAETPQQAWEQIRKNLDCYCSHDELEIGIDVDELGWIMRDEEKGKKD